MKTLARKVLEKSGGLAVLLICALALMALLSGTQIASAHEGDHTYTITADGVDPTNKDDVRNFVLHIKAHWEAVTKMNASEFVLFKSKTSAEPGDWRHGTLYTIRIDEAGTLAHQPYQPIADNGSLYDFMDDNGKMVVKELIDLAKQNQDGGCVDYVLDGESRVSCSVEIEHPFYSSPSAPVTNILIGGLHHGFDDLSFAKVTCPYYEPKKNAAEVVDKNTLKQFVEEFADYYIEQRKKLGPQLFTIRPCWRALPWKYDSIYTFFMTENKRVIFNGNTPELENLTLNVMDGNGVNVGDLIVEEVNDPDGDGFVEYLWDDPTTTDDDVDINMCPTCAPGTSPKLSYITVRETTAGKIFVGSGIYPEVKEDDGGCAIAGNANAPKKPMFNLLFIVSILLSAALWRKPSRENVTMRRKGEFVMKNMATAFFVCTLALPVFFSSVNNAGAHYGNHSDSITANGVTAADPVTMKKFLLHAKAHWESITDPNKNIEFEKSLTEEGDWNSGTIYLMVVDEDGTIFTNGHDPETQNGTLLHYSGEGEERKGTLHPEVMSLIEASKMKEGDCVRYEQEEKVACSVNFKHPVWKTDLILIAGYHYELDDDTRLSFDEIKCPFFTKPIDEKPYLTSGTTANEVRDSDTLKAFVENFKTHLTEQVEKNSKDPAQLAKIRNCWRISPWKHGGIYLFIMTEDKLVFFNGNSPALENSTLDVVDGNGDNVGELTVNSLEDKGEDEGEFVEYLWDDPTTTDDDVDLEQCPDGPQTCAPGNSLKLSYVVSFINPDFFEGQKLIIGSGYHPQMSNDDGCAIAGTGGTAKGGLFNLLLAASVLLLPVFVKITQKTGNRR